MPKFRLLAGSHNEGGLIWENIRGQSAPIIETDKDLDVIFGPEKFLRVSDHEEATEGRDISGILPKPLQEEGAQEFQTPKKKASAKKASAPAKSSKAQQVAEEEEEDEEEEYESVQSELGEDVSSDHPDAQKKGLHVFRKGAYHYVATQDDPETGLTKKGLKAKDLKSFLKNYDPDEVEEEEEDEDE